MRTTEYVVEVIDGDTFRTGVRVGQSIRLADVNTPETGQPGYYAAKRALTDLILWKWVQVEQVAIDAYGRAIAHVWVNGVSVNERMKVFERPRRFWA